MNVSNFSLSYFEVLERLLEEHKKFPLGSGNHEVEGKADIHRIALHFISKTWEEISPELLVPPLFGIRSTVDIPLLPLFLRDLATRGSAFPWAWFRARATEAIRERLGAVIEKIKEREPERYGEYRAALLHGGRYWFRQSPEQHLEAGYHTALAAAWKILGEEVAIVMEEGSSWTPRNSLGVEQALKRFATFHMEFLLASDGVLWDSAGATPYLWRGEELVSREEIVCRVLQKLERGRDGMKEGRLGCPALRATLIGTEGAPRHTVFSGVWSWTEKLFTELYIPSMYPRHGELVCGDESK